MARRAHHDIHTLVRSWQQAQVLQAANIVATVGEVLQAETQQHLPALVKGCEAVIHIATAIPSNPAAPGAWETNTRLRTEGTRSLLDAALQAGATRYIQQSIVMAYPDRGDAWLDEDQSLDTTPARATICGPVIEMERMVRAVPPDRLRWSMLRGGLFGLLDTLSPRVAQRDCRKITLVYETPSQGRSVLSLPCSRFRRTS